MRFGLFKSQEMDWYDSEWQYVVNQDVNYDKGFGDQPVSIRE